MIGKASKLQLQCAGHLHESYQISASQNQSHTLCVVCFVFTEDIHIIITEAEKASPCFSLIFNFPSMTKWPGFYEFVFPQVKRMIGKYHPEEEAKEILRDRLRMFLMIRPEASLDAEYFKRRLLKFRLRAKSTVTHPYMRYPHRPTMAPVSPPHDRKVCLALDESGMSGKGLDDFFRQVRHVTCKFVFSSSSFSKQQTLIVLIVGRNCTACWTL